MLCVQSCNFITASLGFGPRRFATVPSTSTRLLNCWPLTLTSSHSSCTATDTGPIRPETRLQANSDVAFCYHLEHPYMSVMYNIF